MDTGYYKFYRSKKSVLLASLAIVPLCIVSVVSPDMQILGIFALIFFLFMLVKVYIPLIKKQPFIEITPSYIKINNWDRLFWTDIDRVEETTKDIRGRSLHVCNFWPKDVSKYQLTLTQKGNMKMKYSPFSLMLPGPLKEDDCAQLIKILKEKVPNNNLD